MNNTKTIYADLVQFTRHGRKIQRVVQDSDIPLAKAKERATDLADEIGEKGVYVVEVNGIAVFRAPKRMRAWGWWGTSVAALPGGTT